MQHIAVTVCSRPFQWYSCHFLTQISSRVNVFFHLPLQSGPATGKTGRKASLDILHFGSSDVLDKSCVMGGTCAARANHDLLENIMIC